MVQESRNPLVRNGTDDSELTSLLCESILKLGDLQSEIDAIRKDCAQRHASEDTLNVLLLNKYNQLSESRKSAVGNNIGLVSDLPSYVYESNESDLSGWSALRTSVFWIRLLIAVFSMMAFIIMSTSSIADSDWFTPQSLMFVSTIIKIFFFKILFGSHRVTLMYTVVSLTLNRIMQLLVLVLLRLL